jgi:hypothetical protein
LANAPAGIAGSEINLGLTTPTAEDGSLVTVTLADLPAGWVLNGGTQNIDGSWSVQTSDVHSLTVTGPTDSVGALVLHLTETWDQGDGTTAIFALSDNIEAYVAGSPIFAWSGDDFLTGSINPDLFVFSQPIGNDTVYGFDTAADQIDLIGYAGFTTFADVQAHLSDDSAGNAVVALGDGQTVTLQGVSASSLSASDFVFDQTTVTENPGTMVVGNGAMLPLSGDINNTGSIELDSAGSGTLLQLIQHGITLQGSGQIVLSDDDGNVISGTLQGVTLTNVDNTISGAGQIGAGQLDLINGGTINANGSHALTIDTGSNAIENNGTLEASGSGGLVVNSSIDSNGLIWANGSNITLNGSVSGSGNVQVDGAATVTFGAATAINIALAGNATATLVLHDSIDFSGSVSGLDANDHLDLTDMAYAQGASLAYTANLAGTGGVLQISDGAHTANIGLLGQYDAAGFTSAGDGGTGTLISYDPNHHA